jgi:hypothetical protein
MHYLWKVLELSSYLQRCQHRFLFFLFLIFILGSFVKFWVFFNHIIQSQFVIYYFVKLDPHSFKWFFWNTLLNWLLFSISPFNQKIVFIFYFNFDPHSFIVFFNLFFFNFTIQSFFFVFQFWSLFFIFNFGSFYVIDIFFSSSSFNI